jgi:hypothetical protein
VCSVPWPGWNGNGRIMNPAGLKRGAGSPRLEDDEPNPFSILCSSHLGSARDHEPLRHIVVAPTMKSLSGSFVARFAQSDAHGESSDLVREASPIDSREDPTGRIFRIARPDRRCRLQEPAPNRRPRRASCTLDSICLREHRSGSGDLRSEIDGRSRDGIRFNRR